MFALTLTNNKQIDSFNVAKLIAIGIDPGCARRARLDGKPTHYTGYKDDIGQIWVIGDSEKADLPDPDRYINGLPARRITDIFTTLYKHN